MQDPLIIQKLFRKNNGHKNPGLCCSTLPVQGQNICRSFCLSFFFFKSPHFFPTFFFLSLLQPSSLSLSPSLNLVNSFSSYQVGIRQKRLYLEAGAKSCQQMHSSGSYCCSTARRETADSQRGSERERGREHIVS